MLYKTIAHYNNLVEKTNKKSLAEILDKLLNNVDVNRKNINEARKALQQLIDKSHFHIQKVGLVRFNPFSDSGGDQSFVLSILDGKDNGVILTSLNNRGMTRWYAKKVENGKGIDFKLSEEEEKAIKATVHIQPKKI